MRRFLILLVMLMGAVNAAAAQRTVHVRGYTRRDGTYVAPHDRTAPNGTTSDNWSTRGNVNPETGERGTKGDTRPGGYPAAGSSASTSLIQTPPWDGAIATLLSYVPPSQREAARQEILAVLARRLEAGMADAGIIQPAVASRAASQRTIPRLPGAVAEVEVYMPQRLIPFQWRMLSSASLPERSAPENLDQGVILGFQQRAIELRAHAILFRPTLRGFEVVWLVYTGIAGS